MTTIFSSQPFYGQHVWRSTANDPISPRIYNNGKLWSFFQGCLCKGTVFRPPSAHPHIRTSEPPTASAVFLTESTAEGLPLHFRLLSLFISIFIFIYDVIPSRHLLSFSHRTISHFNYYFIVRGLLFVSLYSDIYDFGFPVSPLAQVTSDGLSVSRSG